MKTRDEMTEFLVFHIYDCMDGKEISNLVKQAIRADLNKLSDKELFDRHQECMCYE
jgi:hypothetical protein